MIRIGRQKSKSECLNILFDELRAQDPPSERNSAHKLVSDTLDAIEDKYSGLPKTYQDTGQRMYFWSFDVPGWKNTEGDPAIIVLKNYTAYLYLDGTIQFDKNIGTSSTTVFTLPGAG